MTKDEAQRRRWTFYEAVKFEGALRRGSPIVKIKNLSPFSRGSPSPYLSRDRGENISRDGGERRPHKRLAPDAHALDRVDEVHGPQGFQLAVNSGGLTLASITERIPLAPPFPKGDAARYNLDGNTNCFTFSGVTSLFGRNQYEGDGAPEARSIGA